MCVALFPDQRRMVSGSWDKTLKIWDIETGERLHTLTRHNNIVRCVAVLSDGRIVSGSYSTLKIWDSNTGQCAKTLKGHADAVIAVIVLSDGRIASGGWDNTIKVWNINKDVGWGILKSACEITVTCDRGVWCLAHLSNGRLVAGLGAGYVQIWNIGTQQCTLKKKIHDNDIFSLTVLSNDYVISASYDSALKLWNPNTGDIIRIFSGHSEGVYCVALFPDQRRMVSGSYDKTLRIWDIETGGCLQTLEGHSDYVMCGTVLSDGRIVSGSKDRTLKLWQC